MGVAFGLSPPARRRRSALKGTKRWQFIFSELELPRLKPKGAADAEDVHTVYDDIARKGPQIDKKATMRENLLRNAKRGRMRLGGIDKPDLRYLSHRDVARPRHKAAILLARDVSGPMDADRKRMARLFFYWCVQFLRRRYDQTEIAFVAHTTEAHEVDEPSFFGRAESGGTRVSSAFTTVGQIQRDRYPADDWNVYVLHVSDGDNFSADNRRTLELVRELTGVCSPVGYLEVGAQAGGGGHRLTAFYEQEAGDLDGYEEPEHRPGPYDALFPDEIGAERERIAAERERWAWVGESDPFERVRGVIRDYDDEALLREFLAPKVCEAARLYAFERTTEDPRAIRVSSREANAVRDLLIPQHATFGIPHVEIVDADFRGRGELLLEHRHEGVGLDPEYAAR